MDHSPLENSQDMLYLFHHLFLPPKLPQEDDYGVDCDILLIDVVVDALRSFKLYFSAVDAEVIGLASTMIIDCEVFTPPMARWMKWNLQRF